MIRKFKIKFYSWFSFSHSKTCVKQKAFIENFRTFCVNIRSFSPGVLYTDIHIELLGLQITPKNGLINTLIQCKLQPILFFIPTKHAHSNKIHGLTHKLSILNFFS